METKEKTRFACSCYGCRRIAVRPAEIWHNAQISSKERETHFFSASAMRFFNSRIVDFAAVKSAAGEIDSLSVIVSSKYDDDSKRHYEIVRLCPYGVVSRDSGLLKYETIKQARKEWGAAVANFSACDCHGCILDLESN